MNIYRVGYTHHTSNGPVSGEAAIEAVSGRDAEALFLGLQTYPVDYTVNYVRGA